MQRDIQLTKDGSHTLFVPALNTTYHSHHGAIGESMHVYIQAGLKPAMVTGKHPLRILEIGFGTGLNALLSVREATRHHYPLEYTAIEPFPLSGVEIAALNHGKLLGMQEPFLQLHHADWETDTRINEFFSIRKIHAGFLQAPEISGIDCIYFDAFGPSTQPELWTETVFGHLYHCLETGGILVTYCSKSAVRKAMTDAGFKVIKIPGPWGKREMVRAYRI